VCKYGASFIQQIIHTEFDATFDYPAKGTIVVIHDIVDYQGIIEAKVGRKVYCC